MTRLVILGLFLYPILSCKRNSPHIEQSSSGSVEHLQSTKSDATNAGQYFVENEEGLRLISAAEVGENISGLFKKNTPEVHTDTPAAYITKNKLEELRPKIVSKGYILRKVTPDQGGMNFEISDLKSFQKNWKVFRDKSLQRLTPPKSSATPRVATIDSIKEDLGIRDVDGVLDLTEFNKKQAYLSDLNEIIDMHLPLWRRLKRNTEALESMQREIESYQIEIGKKFAMLHMSETMEFMKVQSLASKMESINPFQISKPQKDILEAAQNALRLKNYKQPFANLSPEARALYEQEMKAQKVAMISRNVTDKGYILQGEGYTTKPFGLKMKSDEFTGKVPIEGSSSAKVTGKLQGEELKKQIKFFNKLSQSSLTKIEEDGLPSSIAKPHMRRMLSEDGTVQNFVAMKRTSGKPISSKDDFQWELADDKSLIDVENFENFHADPRYMKNGTPSLLKEWASSPGVPKDDAQSAVKSYAEFLVKKEEGDNWIHLTDSEKLDRINARILSAKEITSDLDLLQIVTNRRLDYTKAFRYINDAVPESEASAEAVAAVRDAGYRMNEVFGHAMDFRFKPIEDYKEVKGFSAEAMERPPIMHHGTEDKNWDFSQELNNDYPLTFVFQNKNGEYVSTTIPKGNTADLNPKLPHNPHQNYVDALLVMEKEGFQPVMNPVHIITHMKDYANIKEFPLETKVAIKRYWTEFRSNSKDPSKNGLTANQLHEDIVSPEVQAMPMKARKKLGIDTPEGYFYSKFPALDPSTINARSATPR